MKYADERDSDIMVWLMLDVCGLSAMALIDWIPVAIFLLTLGSFSI